MFRFHVDSCKCPTVQIRIAEVKGAIKSGHLALKMVDMLILKVVPMESKSGSSGPKVGDLPWVVKGGGSKGRGFPNIP